MGAGLGVKIDMNQVVVGVGIKIGSIFCATGEVMDEFGQDGKRSIFNAF